MKKVGIYTPHPETPDPDTVSRIEEVSPSAIHPAAWSAYSVAALELGGTVRDAPVAGPLARLRHHVTGAIERGEALPITAVDAPAGYKSTMRATPEQFARIADGIVGVLVRSRKILVGVWDEYQAAGLSHERMRWDLFWEASDQSKGDLFRQTRDLDDAHIDTVLRAVTHVPNS